jgi:hypothetical protein
MLSVSSDALKKVARCANNCRSQGIVGNPLRTDFFAITNLNQAEILHHLKPKFSPKKTRAMSRQQR